MPFCMQCGTQLPETAKFCLQCGTKVEVIEPTEQKPVSVPPVQPTAPPIPPFAQTIQPPQAPQPPQSPQAPQPPQHPQAPQTPQAPQQPQVPAGPPPVTDNAAPGLNNIAFITMTDALDVANGLAFDIEGCMQYGINPHVAQSLNSKLKVSFDFVVKKYGGTGVVGQTFSFFKKAGEALMLGQMPKQNQYEYKPDMWVAVVELTREEAELYNRCAKEAAKREGYQERIIRTCYSCKFQRIINPDYENMLQRQRLADMVLQWKRSILRAIGRSTMDPKFVCLRCQGMQYFDRTIVLCPECGSPCSALFIERCGKCGYDLAGKKSAKLTNIPSVNKPETQSANSQASKPVPGKIIVGKCKSCGNAIRVPLAKVPENGLKGKCSKCGKPVTIRRPKSKEEPKVNQEHMNIATAEQVQEQAPPDDLI